MKNQLDKIIYFVKNTGDKVIVLKDDAEFVIMPLDDYEGLFRHKKQLASLTEEEMLSRINREIALWRESQKAFSDEFDDYEDEDEYEPVPRFRDDDFHYRGLDEIDENDKWVEPDWQDKDDEDTDVFYPKEKFSSLENFSDELPDEDANEDFENKRGFEDVTLPWDEESGSKLSDTRSNPLNTREHLTKNLEKKPRGRVNNFGYPNPADTDGDEPDESMEDFEGDANYDHIPPPPSR